MNADQARQRRVDEALARLVVMNDQVILGVATGRGPCTAQLHYDDPVTKLQLRDQLAAHYRGKGFAVEITHDGIGLKVSF